MIDLLSRLLAWPKSLWSRLARRGHTEQALDDELAAYLDALTAEYQRKGLTSAEARRAALVDMGGIEQVKEATRDAWAGDMVVSALRELRYATRALQRSPTFLVVAVITLGLGIGGATAVFTVIKGSLLRPLPAVSDPRELVTVEPEHVDDSLARFRYSFADGDTFHLNMFPLRRKYVQRLMREVGFQRVTTYGDFQETYQEREPDFFVHVAEKRYIPQDGELP